MNSRVYERLSRHPAAFRRLTGMTVRTFNNLFRQVSPALEKERSDRLNHGRRQRAPGAGGQFKNDMRNRLLMALIWLRAFPTYDVLGFLFGLDRSNVCRNLNPVLAVLRKQLGKEIAWPNAQERKKLNLDRFMLEFADIVAIVEPTEQLMRHPSDDEM